MLHRDYLQQVIEQFVSTISHSLVRALLDHDLGAAEEVENAISELVQLDP